MMCNAWWDYLAWMEPHSVDLWGRVGHLITFSSPARCDCLKASRKLDTKNELILSWKQAFLSTEMQHYGVRDELYVSVTLYIFLSYFLFPSLTCSLSRLKVPPLARGQRPFLIHLDWVNLAKASACVCLCLYLYKNMCMCCCLSVASSAERSNWSQVMLQ